jgi:hypothetical protein
LTIGGDDDSVVVGGLVLIEKIMDNLMLPAPVRFKLGDAASDGLMTMCAEAHRISVESFERRLDQNTTILTERVDRKRRPARRPAQVVVPVLDRSACRGRGSAGSDAAARLTDTSAPATRQIAP